MTQAVHRHAFVVLQMHNMLKQHKNVVLRGKNRYMQSPQREFYRVTTEVFSSVFSTHSIMWGGDGRYSARKGKGSLSWASHTICLGRKRVAPLFPYAPSWWQLSTQAILINSPPCSPFYFERGGNRALGCWGTKRPCTTMVSVLFWLSEQWFAIGSIINGFFTL